MKLITSTILICFSLFIVLSLTLPGCEEDIPQCSECQIASGGSCVKDTSHTEAISCSASGHGTYNFEECKCDCDAGWTGDDCNTSTNTDPCPSTVTDIDGNVYETVEIANRCWTKQNLKTTHYNDGTAIATGLSDSAWENTTSGAYAVYDDDAANLSLGRLYNWYAVQTGKLCPAGWSVPSQADFDSLSAEASGVGAALKATTTWPGSDNATNSTGFTALAAGIKQTNGTYDKKDNLTKFWSRDIGSSYNLPVNLSLQARSDFIDIGYVPKVNGYSCRCVKD